MYRCIGLFWTLSAVTQCAWRQKLVPRGGALGRNCQILALRRFSYLFPPLVAEARCRTRWTTDIMLWPSLCCLYINTRNAPLSLPNRSVSSGNWKQLCSTCWWSMDWILPCLCKTVNVVSLLHGFARLFLVPGSLNKAVCFAIEEWDVLCLRLAFGDGKFCLACYEPLKNDTICQCCLKWAQWQNPHYELLQLLQSWRNKQRW